MADHDGSGGGDSAAAMGRAGGGAGGGVARALTATTERIAKKGKGGNKYWAVLEDKHGDDSQCCLFAVHASWVGMKPYVHEGFGTSHFGSGTHNYRGFNTLGSLAGPDGAGAGGAFGYLAAVTSQRWGMTSDEVRAGLERALGPNGSRQATRFGAYASLRHQGRNEAYEHACDLKHARFTAVRADAARAEAARVETARADATRFEAARLIAVAAAAAAMAAPAVLSEAERLIAAAVTAAAVAASAAASDEAPAEQGTGEWAAATAASAATVASILSEAQDATRDGSVQRRCDLALAATTVDAAVAAPEVQRAESTGSVRRRDAIDDMHAVIRSLRAHVAVLDDALSVQVASTERTAGALALRLERLEAAALVARSAPPVCAWFRSARGCNNGAARRFRHG